MLESKLFIKVTFEDRFVEGKMDRVWRATAEGSTYPFGSGESPAQAVGDLICRFPDVLKIQVIFPNAGRVLPPRAE